MITTASGSGYIKDTPDSRDFKYEDTILKAKASVEPRFKFDDIDLREDINSMPDVYNQGGYNMCIIHSTMASMEYQLSRVFSRKFNTNAFRLNNSLSKSFLYYLARLHDWEYSDVDKDNGISYRHTFSSLLTTGVCFNSMHKEVLPLNTKPSFEACIDANQYRISAFYSIFTTEGIEDALKRKIPVLISINMGACGVIDSNGFSEASKSWDTKHDADHGVLLVGLKNFDFDKEHTYAVIRNSYGTSFGDKGYFYIRLDLLRKYNMVACGVIIVDKIGQYDIDIENPNYSNIDEIPLGTLIVGSNAYDLDYANDFINSSEISKAIVKTNNVFVRMVNGEYVDNITGQRITLSRIIELIGKSITYKSKSGLVTVLNI